MKEWQFNVLFFVGVGGALFLLVAPAIPGLQEIPKNPGAVTGVGTILAYVLTQKKKIVKDNPQDDGGDKKKKKKDPPEPRKETSDA